MPHMPNAPLIYTLGLVRFPAIRMNDFAPSLYEALRSSLPHIDDFDLKQMRVEFGSDGPKVQHEDVKVWQISTPDRKFALVLTPESLALHTNAYRDNESFLSLFKEALSTLASLPKIPLEWITGIGMRYIDLVVPKEGDDLGKMLLASVLPPALSGVERLEIVEGMYVAQYKAPSANVRLQILRNPQAVIPPDIDTPLLARNNWSFVRPASEFAVIDTDCSLPLDGAISLDLERICGDMYSLRTVALSIFDHIGTDYAQSLWKGEAS